MLESIYNITLLDHPLKGYKTIYNLLSQKSICIKNEIRIPTDLPIEYQQRMVQMNMLVSSKADDICNALSLYNEFANLDMLSLTVLLTGKCNCRCIYCYEAGCAIPETADADSVADKILSEMNRLNLSKLFISFFGGEPLLNKKALHKIASKMHICLGEKFSFAIVTNGTLLSPKDIDTWNHLGLESIKVTLDGNKEIHNLRRIYKSGLGTYDDIMTNLEQISGRTKLVINVVLDGTVQNISNMISYVERRKIVAEFDLSLCDPFNGSNQEKRSLLLRFSQELKDHHLTQHSVISNPHGAICMMKQQKSFAIAGDFVYGCVGNLNHPINKNLILTKNTNTTISEVCMECTYLPICFGGCIYTRKCEFDLYHTLIPDILRIYIGSK